MGLFDRFRQWAGNKLMLISGGGLVGWFSYPNRTLATNETVFSAVSMLAGAIASAPVTVRQDYRQLSPAENHIAALLKYGLNPNMTTFEFVRCLETLRDVTGAGYAIKEMDAFGQIRALWLMRTENVTPRVEVDSRELYYEVRDNLTNEVAYLHNSYVVAVSHISEDGINPINPLAVLRGTMEYDREVKEFSINQMKSGLRANIVIKWANSQMNREQIDEYNDVLQRFKKSGVLYMDKGKEITELKGNNLIDPKVFEVEKITIARVARTYNIPFDKLLPEKSSYNSAEQSDLSYLRDTILPMARMYEQEFTKKLLPFSDQHNGIEIKLSLNGFARADMKTRGDFYTKAIRSAWMCPDEVRSLEDQPPIPGGFGQQFFISKDLVAINTLGEKEEKS